MLSSHSLFGMVFLKFSLVCFDRRHRSTFLMGPPNRGRPFPRMDTSGTIGSTYACIKITPTDPTNLGSGIINHPVALFLRGLWVYPNFASIALGSVTRGTRCDYVALLQSCLSILVSERKCLANRNIASEYHVCRAPTVETRWVHAPTLLFDIWLIGKLEAWGLEAGITEQPI